MTTPFSRAVRVEEEDNKIVYYNYSRVFIYQNHLFRVYYDGDMHIWHREWLNKPPNDVLDGWHVSDLRLDDLEARPHLVVTKVNAGRWYFNDAAGLEGGSLKYEDLAMGINIYFKSGSELHIVDYLNGLFGED